MATPTKVLRLNSVKARCGLSRSTIYAFISAGRFPAPINLGSRAVGWLESDIEAWIMQQQQAPRPGRRPIRDTWQVSA